MLLGTDCTSDDESEDETVDGFPQKVLLRVEIEWLAEPLVALKHAVDSYSKKQNPKLRLRKPGNKPLPRKSGSKEADYEGIGKRHAPARLPFNFYDRDFLKCLSRNAQMELAPAKYMEIPVLVSVDHSSLDPIDFVCAENKHLLLWFLRLVIIYQILL